MTEKLLSELKVPELPKLTNGFVVVQEAAWNHLVKYVQCQTETINALIITVESINKLHALTNEKHNFDISKIQSELSDIAKALEGEFVDE